MRAKLMYMRWKNIRKRSYYHANPSQRTHFNVQPTIFHGFSTSRRLVCATINGHYMLS